MTLLPTGPSPTTLTITAGGLPLFRKSQPDGSSRISFDSLSCFTLPPAWGAITAPAAPTPTVGGETASTPCSLTIPAGGWVDANGQLRPYFVQTQIWDTGSFTYHVEGFGAGTGTVVVLPSGEITALRRTVTFGQPASLSGVISFASCIPPVTGRVSPPPEAGITVLAETDGGELTPVAGTVTRGGYWSARVKPLIETTYRIHYDEGGGLVVGRSEDLAIHVRPRVTLKALGRRSFFAHVQALVPHTGRRVSVQRLVRGRWTTIAVVRLAYHSSARFRLSGLSAGTRIRVLLAQEEAEPGYVAGFSRPLTVRS